jgi:predicted signal transduction protein with EAL and GGDEF domain
MNSNNLLNNKIFRLVITVSLIVSILAIIGNIIVGFPFAINIKWIIWVIISVVSLILDKRTNSNKYIKTFFFSFIVYILIPLGWFDSGGTNNNTIAYVFLIMFCIAVLFKGKERIVLTLSLIAIFILLLITDYYYPDLLRVYSEESQFFDRLIQIPLTLLCGFLLVKTFSDAYNNEVAKEQNYALKLEKANNQLEFLSNHDSLSFLYNRRAFDQKVESVLQEKDFHS